MAAVDDREGAAPQGASVLLRRIAARRAQAAPAPAPADPPPAPVARTPDRAVAGAIARAAERVHGLPLFFDRVTIGHATTAEFSELLAEHSLIAVVQGQGDALGAVAICPGLLTSLIEIQALGRISARPAAPRRPTRTDAAICVEFLNACLDELAAELAAHTGFAGMAGYRYASFLDDPRPLGLMLEDVGYRLVTITMRAGAAGQRDGQMIFLLPAAAARAAPAIPAPDDPAAMPSAGAGDRSDDTPGLMADSVRAVPITLIGVLCRRQITLGELQSLAPGDRISLPPGALDAATIETAAGQTLFRGRLGERAGRHALRIAAADGRAAPDGPPPEPEWNGAQTADPAGGDEAFGGGDWGGLGNVEPPIGDIAGLDPFRDPAADGLAALSTSPGFDSDEVDAAAAAALAWDAEDLPEPGAMPLDLQIG